MKLLRVVAPAAFVAIACTSGGSGAGAAPTAAVGPDCDPIVPSHCGLPLPSSRWLVDDGATPTGKRVAFGATTLPEWSPGRPIDPAAFADLDGFSPGMPILTHMPGATTTGLPDQDTIARSLDPSSPTILLDADTGERIAHWAELDMSMPSDVDDRVLVLRPAARLGAGKRYIAAIRGVVDASGAPAAASPAFAALRDRLPEPSVDARRALYEDVFARLARAGVDVGTLQLAWDWTTTSRARTTGKLLAMRDEALATVGDDGPPYVVTGVEENPNIYIRRRISGTMTVPLYLDRAEPGGRLALGADGKPHATGTLEVPFVVHVPNSLASAPAAGPLVMNGHGLLGSMHEGEDDYLAKIADDMHYVAFSCDLLGMASGDASFLTNTLGGDPTGFRSAVDRQHQGLLDELLLMRLMRGRFARDPNLVFGGVSVVDPTQRFYRGDSQGGIFGATYMALTTDVTRGLLGEPGMPYSLLFNRSVDFDGFSFVLHVLYKNPIDVQIVFALLQMWWDETEPDGWAPYIAHDMLPGTPAHDVLIDVALGDHQVTPLGAHVLARAVSAKNVKPVQRDVFGVEAADPPFTGSAMVEWDFGLPPAPETNVPDDDGADPHGKLRLLEPAYQQADRFFRTGVVGSACPSPCVVR